MYSIIDKKDLVRIPRNKFEDDNIVYSYKNRKILLSEPVEVYRNLNKNCYSIRQFGKVVAHGKRLCLKYCKFMVSEFSRYKIRETKRKSVHAVVRGLFTTSGFGTTAIGSKIRLKIEYNPYKEDYFTCYNLITKPVIVKSAKFVVFNEKGVFGAEFN